MDIEWTLWEARNMTHHMSSSLYQTDYDYTIKGWTKCGIIRFISVTVLL